MTLKVEWLQGKVQVVQDGKVIGTKALPPPSKVVGVEDAWLKEVAALSPVKQVEAVAARLKERNPGFDGKVTLGKAEGAMVTEIRFNAGGVTDLSPVRALPGLKALLFNGGKGEILPADLSPLKDMKLTVLACTNTKVSDLSPLKGMPLKDLFCDFKPERDADILRSLKTLEKINGKPAADFWKEVDDKGPDKKP